MKYRLSICCLLSLLNLLSFVRADASFIDWDKQAAEDAKLDRQSIPYDGVSPNKLVCDTTLRRMPDGSWALFLLAGDDFEPSPKNYIGVTRSDDEGRTWSPLAPVETTFPREGLTSGQGPTELMVGEGRATRFLPGSLKSWQEDVWWEDVTERSLRDSAAHWIDTTSVCCAMEPSRATRYLPGGSIVTPREVHQWFAL